MTSYNRDGKVGPWAQEKLKCLSDYLSAYTTILRTQEWCEGYFYVDAFAGAGKAELRAPDRNERSAEQLLLQVGAFNIDDVDERTFINGSPYVALELQHPFTRYIFIDKNPTRIEQLTKIKKEFLGQREIEIVPGDAFAAIRNFLSDRSINWTTHRAVMFLDPFGMQVPWNAIEAIANNGRIEIILNLPVGTAIQRMLPRSGIFSDEQRKSLNAYFGSPEWEDVIYEKSIDLFGETDVTKVERSGERLVEWLRDRLKQAFGFSPPPRLIRNSQGAHLYYLLFAGPNATGAKIASEIFLKQGQKMERHGRSEGHRNSHRDA